MDTSFEESFKYMLINFFYCVEHYGYNHIYFFTGKFIDISSLLTIKNLSSSMNISNLNILHYFEIDFRNQFLVNNNLFSIEYENAFLMYGINTKIESAVLNIKIRKLALASNTNKFFFIGSHIEVNYPLIHVGLTMLSLIDLYHGKHYICYYVMNYKAFNFIHGPSSFMDEYSLFMPLHLSSQLKKVIQYSYNNLFSNDVSIYDLNACSRSDALLIDCIYSEPKYIYLFNSDVVSYISNAIDSFVIYQSHNFDDVVCYANVILPIGTHLDKKGYYLNYQGDTCYSGFVLNSSELLKHTDIHIFFAFHKYVLQNNISIINYKKNSST
jgi:hypothetical protein